MECQVDEVFVNDSKTVGIFGEYSYGTVRSEPGVRRKQQLDNVVFGDSGVKDVALSVVPAPLQSAFPNEVARPAL